MRDVSELIRQGYYQVSSRYRTLAKLPDGKSGIEALGDKNPDQAKSYLRMAERWARDFYLRCYSADKIVLTDEEFKAFKKLNGPVA